MAPDDSFHRGQTDAVSLEFVCLAKGGERHGIFQKESPQAIIRYQDLHSFML
jgi:hypothetical protein